MNCVSKNVEFSKGLDMNDEEMAKEMGISTQEKDIGDIYLLRKSSIFTHGEKPNIKLG